MSRGPTLAERQETRIRELLETFYEPRLQELGLGVEQIARQSLEELQDSLERINDALRNPQAFGELRVRVSSETGPIVVGSSSDSHLTLGILPLLLERKGLILSRIREVGGRSAEQVLERLASGGNGTQDVAQQAAEALEKLRAARTAGQESIEVDKDIVRQRELAALAERRAATAERRAKVWQSFLARESVASIVGGLLLLVLGVGLIVAMFVGTTATGVVTNAFLLILGYFFGQSVVRERAGRGETDRESDLAS